MIDPPTTDRDVIEQLADSFVARLRAGQRPSVEEYARRYPELATEVRELLAAVVLLEQNAGVDGAAFSGTASLPPSVPSEIDDFTIVREIGRGGMGVVYEAVQQSLGRHVALKVLSASALLNPTHLERFRMESRAAARLHHTHIVPVFGIGEHAGLHYYAMQFIRGQSLDHVIEELRHLRGARQANNHTRAEAGDSPTRAAAESMLTRRTAIQAAPLPGDSGGNATASDAVDSLGQTSPSSEFSHSGGPAFYANIARIGMDIAEALAYAHSEGILHRDIKPSNLLIDAKGSVWITDFGLAKDEGADGLTQTGDFIGTLRYMAPERIDGWSDPRSDIYSLGATLYELLALRPLFDDMSRGKLVEQIFYQSPMPPSKFDARVPADLETIVLKATTKEPSERYRTAAEMAEDLRRFLADRPILARRSTPLEQLARWGRRNPLAAALVGAVAVLSLLAVVILSISNARIRRESIARAAALEEKNAALDTARDAIDQMLTRTASDVFADAPRLHPLRVALLDDALKFYEGLASQTGADPLLRHEMANVLHAKANLEGELDRYEAAKQSHRRRIELLQDVVPLDPNPPEYLEELAMAEQDLGLVLYFSNHPPKAQDPRAEEQFRKARDMFADLERRWPDRLQPQVHSVRYLAHFARMRGERVEAERLLNLAIDHGEAFGARRLEDVNEIYETAWACTILYDLLAESSDDRTNEAEATLQRGLRPLTALLEKNADNLQAVDVACALWIRLGLCYCRQERAGDAILVFRRAIAEMEKLCEAFPWNEYYWGNLTWFHDDASTTLTRVDRSNEAAAMLRAYRQWLRSVAAHLPDDAGPRDKLRRSENDLVRLFRAAGLDSDADELMASITPSPAETGSSDPPD